MIVVLDASVVLKWLIADPKREPDTEAAVELMQAVARGELKVLQPIHWLIEVVGVLARHSPQRAIEDALLLQAMRIQTTDDPGILKRAIQLAVDTKQHVFDTLYHAVALETDDALLITADERYRSKARPDQKIVSLRDWEFTV